MILSPFKDKHIFFPQWKSPINEGSDHVEQNLFQPLIIYFQGWLRGFDQNHNGRALRILSNFIKEDGSILQDKKDKIRCSQVKKIIVLERMSMVQRVSNPGCNNKFPSLLFNLV